MTDKPKSQTKIVCGHCGAKIDADELLKPTPLDLAYRELGPRCPKCSGEIFDLPKGDKPAD